MNMKEFTWQADWNMKRKKKPNVNTIRFGDGYEQRQSDGINNNLRTYDVVFSGSEEKIKAIDMFLDECCGVTAFSWQPYGDKKGLFTCGEWDETKKTGYRTLTATFKEVIA